MTGRLLPRLVLAALLTPVAGALTLSPALAEPTAEIDSVTTDDETVRVLVSLVDLSEESEADLAGAEATLDGKAVDAQTELASALGEQVSRVTVLAMDTSSSMRGDRFAGAKAAALAFIDEAPADVQIAIVGFADAAEVIVEPTLDREVLAAAIDSLVLSPKTTLYAGIAEAARVASRADSGSVLVLSDGKDTTGVAPDRLRTDLESLGVKVDVVALEQAQGQLDLLGTISQAAGGSVIDAADPDALTGLFTQQAAELASQIVVSFPVPDDWEGGGATLSVSVPVDGATVTDSAFVDVPSGSPTTEPEATTDAGPQPVDTSTGLSVAKPVMIGGVVGIGLAIVMLAMAVTSVKGPEKETVADRLAAYTGRRRFGATPGARSAASGAGMRQSALDLSEKALATGGLEIKVAARLEAAGMRLNSAEWLLLHSGIAVALPLATFLLTGGNVLLVLLVLPLGIAGPWFYLKRKHTRRIKKFSAQLPETLQLISGSLSAGLAFTQALDTVVREGSDPMASEFRRALVEARLGVNIEDALNGIAERMGSDDFAWMVMAVKIQREVGGNLAELLMTVAATLREREYLRRQVSTLSAEGRLSAWILGGMPPAFVGYLALVQPTYLSPMIHNPIGWVMIGFCTVLMAVGVFWLMKCVKVEI